MLNKISKLESLCRAMQAERQARKMIDTDSVGMSLSARRLVFRTSDLAPRL